MSIPPPASDHDPAPHAPPPRGVHDWLPSRRGLLFMALAFAIGLVLFAVVWRDASREAFYTVEPVARPDSDGAFAPLPAPLPANRERAASGLGERDPMRERERAAERARERELVEQQAAMPPPPEATPVPDAVPLPGPAAATSAPVPLPGQSPAPNYPRRALRRGEGGVVLLRVDVGPDGVPTSVGIVRSSRSRDLDRAAVDAVRRWRFRPAMVEGRPTVGTVDVPIEFAAR